MRSLLGRALGKLAGGLARLAARLTPRQPTLREQRLEAWYAVNGDHTHRVEYDLQPSALVLDLGGFRGDWAAEIFARYRCTIHVFEPSSHFAGYIRNRFSRNPQIIVHELGLGAETRKARMSLCAEGSSLFRHTQTSCDVDIVAARDFFTGHGFEQIDLMKVNIEGGEYELLEHLIAEGLVGRIKDLQVQFHEDVFPDAERRMRNIQSELAQTHRLTFQHEYVWENWRRKR